MATLRLVDENLTLTDSAEIATCLAACGIDYERWPDDGRASAGASAEEVLNAYATEIEALKSRGGYVTADVIDVTPETPGLEAMLAKFNREHWHDEDEVRFIIAGSGVFHIVANEGHGEGRVFAIEVESGDMIRVPRGTRHWFELCADRRIRAIRLFQDVSGWTPHYTGSGRELGFVPDSDLSTSRVSKPQ
ncbi:MAG TPA: cupin domain-containing protein [Pyrinomonadaceae bacterium]|nr:cupin domain-containing protein [Pyrinomonadaceae bacterium]